MTRNTAIALFLGSFLLAGVNFGLGYSYAVVEIRTENLAAKIVASQKMWDTEQLKREISRELWEKFKKEQEKLDAE